MNGENRRAAVVEFRTGPRWIVDRTPQRLAPSKSARILDLRGSFANGQLLAGSGSLVFEGEVLEGVRLN